MRRFEYVEGGSSKFWEVGLVGEQITVRYGRIGTAGQTQTRSCASPSAAQAEHDKLIREKTGKGYREVGTAAASPVMPAAPAIPTQGPTGQAPAAPRSPEPLPPAPAPAAAVATVRTTEPVATSAVTAVKEGSAAEAAVEPGPEPQPPGEFLWTPGWRRLLPPWRGIDTPSPPALVESVCMAELQAGTLKARARLKDAPTALAMLGAATPGALYAPPGSADLAEWSTLCGHLMTGMRQMHGDVITARALWRLAAARHGLPFALQLVLDAVQAAPPAARDYSGLIEGIDLPELRARCVAASEPEYAQLYAIAQAQSARSGLMASIVAYLFPTEATLLAPAIARLGNQGGDARAHLLVGCRLSRADLQALIQNMGNAWGRFEVTRELLLNLARLRVPEALPLAFKRAQLDHYADHRRPYLEIARAHDSAEALAGLIARFDDKDARALIDGYAHQWPQLAIRLAAEHCSSREDRALADWLQRFCITERTALQAARCNASETIRPLLDRIAASLPKALTLAAPSELPNWLQAPPWRQRKRSAAPSYPALVPLDQMAHMRWLPGEQARWQNGLTPEGMRVNVWQPELRGLSGQDFLRAVLRLFGVPEAQHETTLAGRSPSRETLGQRRWASSGLLMLLPKAAAAAVLRAWGPDGWYDMETSRLEQVIAWLNELAPPLLEEFPRVNLERGLQLAQPLASAPIASVAAAALRQGKRVRPLAQAWLLRHADVAALALLPQLGDRKLSDDAQFALRLMLGNGRAAEIEAAAASYGDSGRAALAALRAFDPMNLAPTRLPTLPDFWQPRSYARPLLPDGRGLPDEVLDAIGEMLAFSPMEPRYAGLDALRELCTPASLGAHAWDLFQAWITAGAPAKDSWAFAALAHLGDDECARRLARLIRTWPTEGASARAASGLDILAAMGSDVALMLLHGIAQKVKSKPLQLKAQARLEHLALSLGLSAEELADRLVPDLGLDDSGTLLLDFGARQFRVGFDEHLKPRVYDAHGALLKDLPGVLKSDDQALANDASARYKALKKDVRTLASQQLWRLEQAMVRQRRWSAAAFRRCFVEHPLLRHLARRLLWGRYEQDQLIECLRVAEDLSYADSRDDLLTLADDAEVGIVHPLELSPADAAAFGQIYADYEILQPFAQLGREVWRLSAEQAAGNEYAGCAGRKVATVGVFALESRGWERDGDDSGGMVGGLRRELGSDLVVELSFEPGYVVGSPRSEPEQTLHALQLHRSNRWGAEPGVRWSDVNPVLVSEVLRDVERLAAK